MSLRCKLHWHRYEATINFLGWACIYCGKKKLVQDYNSY